MNLIEFNSFIEDIDGDLLDVKRKDLEYCIQVERAVYNERIIEESRQKQISFPTIQIEKKQFNTFKLNIQPHRNQYEQVSSQNHEQLLPRICQNQDKIVQFIDQIDNIANHNKQEQSQQQNTQLDYSCEIIEPPFETKAPTAGIIKRGIQKRKESEFGKRKININLISSDIESIPSNPVQQLQLKKLKPTQPFFISPLPPPLSALQSKNHERVDPKLIHKNQPRPFSLNQQQGPSNQRYRFQNTQESSRNWSPRKNQHNPTELFSQYSFQKQQQALPLPPLLPVLSESTNFSLFAPPPSQPYTSLRSEAKITENNTRPETNQEEIENISFEERLCRIAQESENRSNQEFLQQQREAIHARQELLAQSIKRFYSAQHSLNIYQHRQQQQRQLKPQKSLLQKKCIIPNRYSSIYQQKPSTLASVPKQVIEVLNQIISSSEDEESEILIESDTDISIESTEPRYSHESDHFQLNHPTISKKLHSRCVTELAFFAASNLASIACTGKELSILSASPQLSNNKLQQYSLDLADETVSQISGYADLLFCVASLNFLLLFEKAKETHHEKGLVLVDVLESCHILSIESYTYISSNDAIITAGQRQIRYWSRNPISKKMENTWTSDTGPAENLLLAYDPHSSDLYYSTNSSIVSYGKISNFGIGNKNNWEIRPMEEHLPKRTTSATAIQLESIRLISFKHYKRILLTTYRLEAEGIIATYKLPSKKATDIYRTPSQIKQWKFSPSLCSFIILCNEKSKSSSQILILNHHLKPLRRLTTLETQFRALAAISDSLITCLELYTDKNPKEPEKLALGYENGLLQIFPFVSC